jgi:disintegrin and metalloproteinase domain-containing protein 10
MFASATSGDRPNNSKFSTCSVKNISNVLDAIEESKKRNCFQASEGACKFAISRFRALSNRFIVLVILVCGNKIVESGEECDCGFNDDECMDKCCYPRVISEYDSSLNGKLMNFEVKIQ